MHISPFYGCKYNNYKPETFSSNFSIPLSIETNKFKMIYNKCGQRVGDAPRFQLNSKLYSVAVIYGIPFELSMDLMGGNDLRS